VDIQNLISTAIVDEIAEVQQKIIRFMKFHEGPYPVTDPDFLHRGSHARI
jgi:hypothetical protein